MRFSFTAATERAIAFASDWCSRTGREELDPESLLVGLLSESECRAAVMLAKHGVDIPAVCQKWPTLVPPSPKTSQCNGGESLADDSPHGGDFCRIPLSSDVECSIQAACDRLDFLPRRPELATEHLLLGLVSADHDVAIWLRQRGFDPDSLEAEIRRLLGFEIANDDESFANPSTGRDARLAADGTSAPESPQAAVLAPRWDGSCTAIPCSPQRGGSSTAAPTASDVLRVLDAAANRAREGLRVIEDFVRFVLDDRHLTQLCKQLRHDLTAGLSPISIDSRMAARETQGDVGTVLTTSSEQCRDDMASVVRANFARLQESLRSLEEFGKLWTGGADISWGGSCTATPGATVQLSPQRTNLGLSELFKQLRYRTYTLERAVELTRGSIQRLDSVRLYVLVDGRDSPEEFERLVRSLIDAGVHAIQLRDKQLGDRELLVRARLLQAMTLETQTLCVINDRPDLAALAYADGVHVGQEEISVKDARRIVGPETLVGVSTHSIEQARRAVLDGANYIGVGPTFLSSTKTFEQFPGLDLLRAVAAEIRLPAFAIGGITKENVGDVLAAGFSRIAVSGAVAAAADPAEAARQLLAALGK